MGTQSSQPPVSSMYGKTTYGTNPLGWGGPNMRWGSTDQGTNMGYAQMNMPGMPATYQQSAQALYGTPWSSNPMQYWRWNWIGQQQTPPPGQPGTPPVVTPPGTTTPPPVTQPPTTTPPGTTTPPPGSGGNGVPQPPVFQPPNTVNGVIGGPTRPWTPGPNANRPNPMQPVGEEAIRAANAARDARTKQFLGQQIGGGDWASAIRAMLPPR